MLTVVDNGDGTCNVHFSGTVAGLPGPGNDFTVDTAGGPEIPSPWATVNATTIQGGIADHLSAGQLATVTTWDGMTAPGATLQVPDSATQS